MTAASKIESDDTLWDPALEARTDLQSWLGCTVGSRHTLVKHLASGGMGHVFLAEHGALGSQVAVKILPSRSSPPLHARFLAEAQLLSSINHPNIVKIFDAGELGDDSPYMMMEYVTGVDLGSWFESGQPRSVKRILRILRQVASALDYLHAKGVVHRDIKPANILVDPAAHDAVKLLDFGIAIREGAEDSKLEHGLLGTPAYMAPEQVAGGGCGRAIDLYALGALALELLTGKPPYDYPSLNLMLAAVLHERPSLPSSRGIHFAGFDAVIERALARDPNARFHSAGELVEALTAVFSTSSRPSRPSLPSPAFVRPSLSRAPAALPPSTADRRHVFAMFRGMVAVACGAAAWLA